MSKDSKTIQELQMTLPWGAHQYTARFLADDAPHRDFIHAIDHIDKARAKFNELRDAVHHPGRNWEQIYAEERAECEKGIADLMICTLRAANAYPNGPINVQKAYDERVADKFGSKP